jgi:hypothetical protein
MPDNLLNTDHKILARIVASRLGLTPSALMH